jgi:hypothetical protein
MKTPLAPVLLIASLAFIACGPPMPTDPDLSCTGAGTATLTEVHAVFTAKCVSCHIAGYTYGDYTTEAKSGEVVNKKSLYAGMPGTLKVVEPGKLENSSLWLKILGGATKARTGPKGENVFGAMPNDGTTLDAAQQKTIKDWICSGAK